MATLQYTPLNPSKKQIRLLTLLPGEWDERIRCELYVASLQDQPKYEVKHDGIRVTPIGFTLTVQPGFVLYMGTASRSRGYLCQRHSIPSYPEPLRGIKKAEGPDSDCEG